MLSDDQVASLMKHLVPFAGREARLESSLRRRDWHAVLSNIPKNMEELTQTGTTVPPHFAGAGMSPRWEAFVTICQFLSDEEYWSLLGRVWVETEKRIDSNTAQKLFAPSIRNHSLRSLMMDDIERRNLNDLPEEMTIYRGGTGEATDYWAWTLVEDIAHDFASDANALQMAGDEQVGCVCAAICDRANIVALFLRKGEAEVIIDPRTLRSPEIIWAVPQEDTYAPPDDAYAALARAKQQAAQQRPPTVRE